MSEDHDALPNEPCPHCAERGKIELGFEFTMAFQPIVDVEGQTIYAHEALVRGVNGEGAGHVLSQLTDENMYGFDQAARIKAIELAAEKGLKDRNAERLSINFLPNAVYKPETCIRRTLAAARRTGFPLDRLIFEVTEGEEIKDRAHLRDILNEYKKQGFATALDDFGAGHSGLNVLADLQPDIIKLDMALTRGIDADTARQSIVRGIAGVCQSLNIIMVAEGIETEGEKKALQDQGINLMQGYYFARPCFEDLIQAADLSGF